MYKKVEILEEKLVRADKIELDRLSREISKNSELRRMLVSPMKEIPQYHYLWSSESAFMGDYSLFDAIEIMLKYERHRNLYLSKIGNEFTGLVVYTDNGRVIDKIKIASFKDDRMRANPMFAKDLIEFVLEMAPKRDSIEWYVDPENTRAIRQYNALLDRKGFNWKSERDGKTIKYTVQGFKAGVSAQNA
jgi:hypothetical protein